MKRTANDVNKIDFPLKSFVTTAAASSEPEKALNAAANSEVSFVLTFLTKPKLCARCVIDSITVALSEIRDGSSPFLYFLEDETSDGGTLSNQRPRQNCSQLLPQ